jgi:hypothetical protein
LLISIVLLIPLVSILYKSFRPDTLLKISLNTIDSKLKYFESLKTKELDPPKVFQEIVDHLTQISVVASWSFKNKSYRQISDIQKPFTTVLIHCLDYYKYLDDVPAAEMFDGDYFEAYEFKLLPMICVGLQDRKKKIYETTIDFCDGCDQPIRMFNILFQPLKNVIIDSVYKNGMNSKELIDIIIVIAKFSADLKIENWRRSIFLLMLGHFTDGVQSLPKELRQNSEVVYLWKTLMSSMASMKLDKQKDNLNEYVDFAEVQFGVDRT